MAEQNEYALQPPNGSSAVVIRGASRRDALLDRGYTLVEEGDKTKASPGQKRRVKPDKE